MSRIISSSPGDRLNWSQVYFGVALTTLATLVLELSLTRIFSVVFLYHFAFLAISIALFGLGAGGVLSYLIAAKGKALYGRLGYLASAVSLTTVAALLVALSRREADLATLTVVYFATAVPFVFAGMIVSLAISETIERVDRVYFFDLMGAAAGCLVLVPFLNVFGGPNTVIIAGVFYAVSASIWFNLGGSSRGRAAGVALALLLVALIVVNMTKPLIDITFAKGTRLSNEVFVKWNSFSRIAVRGDPAAGNAEVVIDADASTGIANFDFDNLTEKNRKDLTLQGPGFPYQVRPGGKTLIIGPGGGWDVSRALAAGSTDITGVEINPIIANTVMRERFAKFSRNLYFRPEVRIFVEDGRSFIRRSDEKYQIIQATLVDTWASTAAGAFALSENNLYTTEAFHDYLNHLTPDGILAFTRWGFEPPRESLRLLSLARVALDQLGEHDYRNHFIVVREGTAKELAAWGARDTVLISRKPFSQADLDRARATIAASEMEVVYMPGDPASKNSFAAFLHTSNPEEFFADYRYDVSPVNDNRPFFFYTVQPRDIFSYFRTASGDSADYKINTAVPLLFALVAISILATIVIIVLPPVVLKARLPREPGVLTFLFYFVFIGVGYILIQVALIQKFVLLLGHPTYALTVIIFSMLVSSGLGSYFSTRVLGGSDARLMRALLLVAALVGILALVAPAVSNAGIAWPLPLKMLVTAVMIAVPAFAMGMPFPIGLARLERRHPVSVRWAWALNAASSVLGSASAIFLAIYMGLQNTLLAGGLMYLLAALIVRLTRSKPSPA